MTYTDRGGTKHTIIFSADSRKEAETLRDTVLEKEGVKCSELEEGEEFAPGCVAFDSLRRKEKLLELEGKKLDEWEKYNWSFIGRTFGHVGEL